ncbi:MAG: M48 family metalloprotease [Planctomycetota bacterium]
MSYYRNQQQPHQRGRRRQSVSGWKIRLIIAGGIILFSAISYYGSGTQNPITGETQRVGGMTPAQEVEIGRNAAYGMVQQHGGITSDSQAGLSVARIGKRIENALYHKLQDQGIRMPYTFDFHLLADRQVVNAFALPGGQVFITEALFRRMTDEGQLAGVLGHEIGHVIERHGIERMAQGNFYQRMAGAAGVAGGGANSAQMASAVLRSFQLSYGREAELESDRWGVELMVLTGYNPEHMLEVMDILEEASAGGSPPEFMSSHPKPANRQKYIRDVIQEMFPQGLPPNLR